MYKRMLLLLSVFTLSGLTLSAKIVVNYDDEPANKMRLLAKLTAKP